MTTSTYLDSVIKILPAVQARNITDLLNDLKATGQVRNADEYQHKLQELSVLVNDTDPKPSFKQIRSLIWHLISSDGHNIMMKAAQADLSAIFQQVDEIGKKVNDHHFLIMKNLAADMERGLADQANTISRLEWLANQNNEFSLALVNSFVSASLLKVPRSELDAENLYFDNRTYQNRTEAELPSAVVSEHGQMLLLGSSNEPKVLPISARLHTDASSYGTQIQLDIDNNILNVIDGTKGTYWTRNVYLADPVSKVTTVVEFDLGVAKDINYIIIEGATQTPFFVEGIQAIAPDGHTITLQSESTEINSWERINFDRILARSIKITFSIKSYLKMDYIVDPKNEVWNALDKKAISYNDTDLIEKFGPLATEALNSTNLAEVLNIPTGDPSMMDAYMYPFALDNVWFGNSIYEDSGIFVSKPLKGQNFGVCAIQAIEDVTTDESINNSIEYEMTKKDITPKYTETRFPVPYFEQTTVASERLILTKRISDATQNDAGALRFCPYVDTVWIWGEPNSISIYKNENELQLGTDFDIAISLNSSGSALYWVSAWDDASADSRDFSYYTLLPQKMWIKIRNPDPTAVYTANYTIRTSDTYVDSNTVWLDVNKTVFLSEGGRAYFRRDNPDVTMDSELYLQITMRRNTASQSSTPKLSEYALLGATYYN